MVCERTVDFTTIYPTLTDLAGIPTPAHVEGKSIRPLLENPQGKWDEPAMTTYGPGNHSVRTEGWRYIRYANGDEELYDEANDPYEWTNLAGDSAHADRKTELARHLPQSEQPNVGKGDEAPTPNEN
jgi:arylsulfatase A-like enzyme